MGYVFQQALKRHEEGKGSGGFFGPVDPEVKGNSRQWDIVYYDGDIYKAGVGGQGLYISPSRNLVVAMFSAVSADWANYGRAIAKTYDPVDQR